MKILDYIPHRMYVEDVIEQADVLKDLSQLDEVFDITNDDGLIQWKQKI